MTSGTEPVVAAVEPPVTQWRPIVRYAPAGTWPPERVLDALRDWQREFGSPPATHHWSPTTARAHEGRLRPPRCASSTGRFER